MQHIVTPKTYNVCPLTVVLCSLDKSQCKFAKPES